MKKWNCISSTPGPEIPLFDVQLKTYMNPRNDTPVDILQLRCHDTVNVICETVDQEMVLVRQFRFGVEDYFTELPAGLLDAGEEPLQAAIRELREETGFTSDQWELLGVSYINPSYVNNRCFHYLAQQARRTTPISLDLSEDVEVIMVPTDEVWEWMTVGKIQDAMSKAAILHRFQKIAE